MNWRMSLIALLAAAPAHAGECNTYVLEFDDSVTVEEAGDHVLLTDKFGERRLTLAYAKSFGAIVNVAFNPEDDAESYLFSHTEIDGTRVMLFNSLLFLPACL